MIFFTGLELELWSGVFVTCVGKCLLCCHGLDHVISHAGRTETLGVTYLALAGLCIGVGEIIGETFAARQRLLSAVKVVDYLEYSVG